jgi:hypothetical protein
MTDEIESAFGYRQFTKACDLLEDLVAKIQSALQSAQAINWRVPELQLELARAYEALSRDEEAEATFAAAAASAKRINGCPTSEEFVQFALGEFYLRRRKYDRALQASQFVRSGEPSADAWLPECKPMWASDSRLKPMKLRLHTSPQHRAKTARNSRWRLSLVMLQRRPKKWLEFARVSRPTRKSDALLLAAQPER